MPTTTPAADPTTATPAPQPAVRIEEFNDWLRRGQRGISSETIVAHLSGINVTTYRDVPYDPADFRRCEMLLRAVPAARGNLHRMGEVSEAWARFAAHWTELVELAQSEARGIFDDPRASGSAPKLYARMQEILRPTA